MHIDNIIQLPNSSDRLDKMAKGMGKRTSLTCFPAGSTLAGIMQSILLKAKLHNARVTEAVLEYEGSLSIDADLMDAVKIAPYEKILVANMENGNRFETYAIVGERGSGIIGLNGATTHKGAVGDRLIIFTFCVVPDEEIPQHQPLVLMLDENNKPIGGLKEI